MKHLMPNKKKYGLSLLAFIGLSVITYLFVMTECDFMQLAELVISARWQYLLAAFLTMLLFFALEGESVRSLLVEQGCQMSFFTAWRYALVNFYFSSITPASCGGQPSQIYYMRKQGIGVGASSLAVLLFNLCYHLAALSVGSMVLLLGGQKIIAALGGFSYLLYWGLAVQGLLLLMFCVVVFCHGLTARLVRLLLRLPSIRDKQGFILKVNMQIEAYRQGAEQIRRQPLVLLKVFLLSVGHVVALYSIPFWIYKALALNGCDYLTLVAMQAALMLAVESLPIPGGVGITEKVFLLLYGGIFGSALVVPAVLLCRGIATYTFVIIGAAAAFFPWPRKKRTCAV
ncbi:MAG: lysylphosphatidylglycerol synthase transmembrane domain-containing protein [Clostridia bacterium]|nr:lysylphosphatidylglycerol synthase transmembrane domain-containing protein [Clostridia bacterium]MDD4798418.1 lysylphosphatidylglycerol synthase transmembrane domain-containing protein [Clostridia bacterium]